MSNKINLFDSNFDDEANTIKQEIYKIDVHNNKEVIAFLNMINDKFDMEDRKTCLAILGMVVLSAGYYHQMYNGTHEELSTHEKDLNNKDNS